jgi:outer membrane scaffolding protein for murein synthesis (MipA/OmpV family)
LIRDAASSPIIRTAGSRNQWNFGAVASYTFSWSR